jgi:hypothetical protein
MHNLNLKYLQEAFEIVVGESGPASEAHKADIESAIREILDHIG